MDSIKYIHAADLHLGAPLSGIAKNDLYDDQLTRTLQENAYAVLNKLASLCKSEKPDFVVLAGDMYDQDNNGLQAQIALRDFCAGLNEMGIAVFLAHGNHDPLSSRITSLPWPDNTFIFTETPNPVPVKKNNETISLVHGASYSRENEDRNLARSFHRAPGFDGFQLGVLHCAMDDSPASIHNAPCSLVDLSATGLDAWALGHEHKQNILQTKPFIAYAGSAQGLNADEAGKKGCLIVTANRAGDSWSCEADFRPLASIQWEKADVDLTGITEPEDLVIKINQTLRDLISSSSPELKGLLVTLILSGHSSLYEFLAKPENLKEISARLAHYSTGNPPLWIINIKNCLKPLPDSENYGLGDDLCGETARLVEMLASDEARMTSFIREALAPLYDNPLADELPPMTLPRMTEILEKGGLACRIALESK